MADKQLTIQAQWADFGCWSFWTNDTFDGAYTNIYILGSQINDITAQGTKLIVDGVGLMYFRDPVGVVFEPAIYSRGVLCYLSKFVTTQKWDANHWPMLGVPLNVSENYHFFNAFIFGNTVALDVCRVSMWGHYVDWIGAAPSPAPLPVTVEGVHLWRRG